MRAPNWSSAEFETLLQQPELGSDALVALLPQRTVGAVDVVRQGIHAYHVGGRDVSMLSRIMLRRLQQLAFTCPVCKATL